MKTKLTLKVATALLSLSTLSSPLSAWAQGTAFTYQGRLNDSAGAANGIYDLRFTIYDASGGPGVIAGPVTNSPTSVSNGMFTVALDFGTGVFTGAERWLEIAVRTNGGEAFTALTPRQKLTPTPYAITSGNLSGALPAAQLSGTLPAASLPTGGNWALNSTLTLDGGTLAVDPLNHRVGIGTFSPSTALTIQPLGSAFGIEHTDGERRLSTYLDGSGCWFGSVSPHPLNFFVNNGGSALTIDTAGRVGIGNLNPAYPLHLVGDLGGARFDSTANPNGSVLELRNTMASPNYLGAINFNNAAGTFPGQIGYLASHDLVVRTAVAERLRVDGSGRVDIGTSNPQETLHVSGNVRVDGTISVSQATRYLSISPAEWITTEASSLVVAHTGLGALFAFKNGAAPFMVAPVQLPHGARINHIYAQVYDYTPTGKVEIQLQRSSVVGVTVETIATMGTTVPDEPIVTLINPAATFSHTVDNQFWSYHLFASAGGLTGVGTVVIRYTVTDPLP